MERLEPEGFFVALSSTYYITAGSFDSMQRVLKTGDWMLRFMLIIFVFTTTIMLNILIGLVNHAFDNDDRISKFEWLENRMLWVTSAENLLRGVPFFKSKDWFPEKIYYTATPQQVRKYRQESQRLSKSSAAAALPLDSNLQGKPDSHAATSSDQQDAQQQEQENLMIDQMRELKDQLESQKRQSDEQIRQLQTQLSDILAILRSGQKQA
ncbi:hypothetical protein EC991_001832 [Linnemannia zychae]|nr:hypothetical protein EC991_001832 [Linnemannia zychae]